MQVVGGATTNPDAQHPAPARLVHAGLVPPHPAAQRLGQRAQLLLQARQVGGGGAQQLAPQLGQALQHRHEHALDLWAGRQGRAAASRPAATRPGIRGAGIAVCLCQPAAPGKPTPPACTVLAS